MPWNSVQQKFFERDRPAFHRIIANTKRGSHRIKLHAQQGSFIKIVTVPLSCCCFVIEDIPGIFAWTYTALPLCVLAMSTTTECSLAFILSAVMLELCRWGHGMHCSCSSPKLCGVIDPGDPRHPSPGDWHARCGVMRAHGERCLDGPYCAEMVTLGCATGDLLMPFEAVVMAPTLAQWGGDSGDGDLGESLFGGNDEWCTWTTGP